ncbi:MAG: oligosaccharide flippase family protein [Coriobacteriia bacterium]|nr:oligosaccharide flippase family protein [Coriobacteriia bacterium]
MSRRGGVVSSYILLAVEVVSSLLFTPFLIRSLGQAEFGLYSLVASITAYFLLLDAGVGNALVRYVAMYRVQNDLEQQRKLLGLSLLFYGAMAGVTVLLGLQLLQNLSSVFGKGLTVEELQLARTLLSITVFNAGATLVIGAFTRTIVAYERFVLSKSLAIVKLLLRVVILIALLSMGYGAVAVVTVNLALTLALGAVSAYYVLFVLELRPRFSGMQFSFLREILGYSVFIVIQMIATQINSMADQILLGIMTSSAIIAVYAVGAQISVYFQSIAASINGVLMPGVVRMVEIGTSPDKLLSEMVKIGRIVFMILGLIVTGFAVVGESFVKLWVGDEYSEAYWVGLILMAALLLYLTQSIGTQVLWAMGRHKVQAILKICVAVANIGLTVLFIQWQPLVGAALATATAYLVGDVAVMNVVFSRSIGISMKDYYRGLFAGILPSLMIVALVGALVGLLGLQGWTGLVVEGSSMLMVYAVCMFAFGMNSYEKSLVKSFARDTGMRS